MITPEAGSAYRAIILADNQEGILAARIGQSAGDQTITDLGFAAARDGDGNPVDDGLNDFGQVAYRATLSNGEQAVHVFTPDLLWRRTFSGDWDDGVNWTVGLVPGHVHDVFIRTPNGVSVDGPEEDTRIRSLRIGSTGSSTDRLTLDQPVTVTVTEGITIDRRGSISHRSGELRGSQLTNGGSFVQDAGAFMEFSAITNETTGTMILGGHSIVDAVSTGADAAIVNRGSIEIEAGGFVDAVADAGGAGLYNLGTFTLDGGGLFGPAVADALLNDFGATFRGHGEIDGRSGATMTNNGAMELTGRLDVLVAVRNRGSVIIGNNETLATDHLMGNEGLIELTGGVIAPADTAGAALTNRAGGVIRSGDGGGLGEFGGGGGSGGAVLVHTTNTGGLIHANSSLPLVFTELASNINGGELRIADGSTLQILNDFDNEGSIVMGGPNALMSGGVITNTGSISGR